MVTDNKRNDNIPSVIEDKRNGVSYDIGELLGKGGFAYVYRVKRKNDLLSFAMKIILKKKEENIKKKIETEVQIHKEVKHPNVVEFISYFETKEFFCIVLELCEKKTLSDLIKKTPLRNEEAQKYFYQLVCVIKKLHDLKIIHRDLKLSNILLDSQKNIKLCDFGLATVLKNKEERKKGICGTPNYIAPEVVFPNKEGYSFEVDLWSLGVLLFTFLVGIPPFQQPKIKDIYAKIKRGVFSYPQGVRVSTYAKDIIKKLLQKDPLKRISLEEVFTHSFLQNTERIQERPIQERPQNISIMTKTQKDTKEKRKLLGDVTNKKNKIKKEEIKPRKVSHVFFSIFENISKTISELNSNKSSQKQNIDKPIPNHVVEWLDKTHKYGLGYIMANGVTGVLFNDKTSLCVSLENVFEYVETVDGFKQIKRYLPNEEIKDFCLKKKMDILFKFKNFFSKKRKNSLKFKKMEKTFVVKHVFTKKALFIRLGSNNVQAFFFDDSMLTIFCEGLFLLWKKNSKVKIQTLKTDSLVSGKDDCIIERLFYIKDFISSCMS